MNTAAPSLDLDRLEKVRDLSDKITARCPACAEEGHDRTGNHLAIFPTGKFTCVAYPDDTEHRRRIFALVGIKTDPPRRDPEEDRRWKQDQDERRRREQAKARITEAARRQRSDIVSRFQWDDADLWEDSPTRPEEAADNPGLFLASLFRPDDLIWTGQVHDTGKAHHANRWRTMAEWFQSPLSEVGPMTTPSTWKAGTISRSKENVETAPYVVLDFDGPKGWRPDENELRGHISDSLALVRWLREAMRWRLAAIVHTGGKSVHAWFEDPGAACVDSLRNVLDPFGIDGSLIGHPEHPCRLPGQQHQNTGKTSRVLWLR